MYYAICGVIKQDFFGRNGRYNLFQSIHNFYFVFYSERLETIWIMSSEEFLNECVTNKNGKNAGKRSIWFNGNRKDPKTGEKKEYCKEQYEKYIETDFSRFLSKKVLHKDV